VVQEEAVSIETIIKPTIVYLDFDFDLGDRKTALQYLELPK